MNLTLLRLLLRFREGVVVGHDRAIELGDRRLAVEHLAQRVELDGVVEEQRHEPLQVARSEGVADGFAGRHELAFGRCCEAISA
jgi:hypothetical protein